MKQYYTNRYLCPVHGRQFCPLTPVKGRRCPTTDLCQPRRLRLAQTQQGSACHHYVVVYGHRAGLVSGSAHRGLNTPLLGAGVVSLNLGNRSKVLSLHRQGRDKDLVGFTNPTEVVGH